jgi:hypothetical protein
MRVSQLTIRDPDGSTPFSTLPLRSRYNIDSPHNPPLLSDFELLLRNSSSIASRNSLTHRSSTECHSEGMVELFISRGAKTMQLSVRGLTSNELNLLVKELGMKEMMD